MMDAIWIYTQFIVTLSCNFSYNFVIGLQFKQIYFTFGYFTGNPSAFGRVSIIVGRLVCGSNSKAFSSRTDNFSSFGRATITVGCGSIDKVSSSRIDNSSVSGRRSITVGR